MKRGQTIKAARATEREPIKTYGHPVLVLGDPAICYPKKSFGTRGI